MGVDLSIDGSYIVEAFDGRVVAVQPDCIRELDMVDDSTPLAESGADLSSIDRRLLNLRQVPPPRPATGRAPSVAAAVGAPPPTSGLLDRRISLSPSACTTASWRLHLTLQGAAVGAICTGALARAAPTKSGGWGPYSPAARMMMIDRSVLVMLRAGSRANLRNRYRSEGEESARPPARPEPSIHGSMHPYGLRPMQVDHHVSLGGGAWHDVLQRRSP